MNIIARTRKNKLLLTILILGFCLRILNPTFGSPVLYVNGDEPPNYMGALYMIANKTPFVTTSIYPPLGSYIQIPFLLLAFTILLVFRFNSLAELKLFLATNQGYLLFIPRLISGILGTLTIWLVYKIAQEIFPNHRFVALFSSLLFALSFNHGQVSHSGRPWAPAIFFFALVIWYSLRSVRQDKNVKRFCFLAGLFAAIAFGFHQVGIFALGFFVLTRLFGQKRQRLLIFDKHTFLGVAVAVLGIVIMQSLRFQAPTTKWLSVKQYPGFWQNIFHLISDHHLVKNLKQLMIIETTIFTFFLPSLWQKASWKRPHISNFMFILGTLLAFGVVFMQPRYMLPVLLLMSIYSARIIQQILQIPALKKFSSWLLIIIVTTAAYNLVQLNILFLRTPTFIQAKQWIENNIPPEKVILTTASKFSIFAPAKDVLEIQQRYNPNFYQEAAKSLRPGQYPQNVRNVVYLDQFIDLHDRKGLAKLIENFPLSYKYIIDLHGHSQQSNLVYVDKTNLVEIASFSPLKTGEPEVYLENILSTVHQPLFMLLSRLERMGFYIDIYMVNDTI